MMNMHDAAHVPAQDRGKENPHGLLELTLSSLRAAAALQIAAGHMRAELFPGLSTLAQPPLAYQALAFFTGFAHQSVVLLFVLSGWLVGGKLLGTAPTARALGLYAIDRLTRLWTVQIPSFLLILLLGLALEAPRALSGSAADLRAWSFATAAGNLVGLQNIAVPNFGLNYSLWTLAHQFWYYVMFPLVLIGTSAATWRRKAGALACVAGLLLWLPGDIAIYFVIWVLSAAFSTVRIRAGHGGRAAMAAMCLGLAIYQRLFGWKDDLVTASFAQDLALALAVLVLLASLRTAGAWRVPACMRTVVTVAAACSFTLYVLHVPCIRLARHGLAAGFHIARLDPAIPLHYAVYAAVLAAAIRSPRARVRVRPSAEIATRRH